MLVCQNLSFSIENRKLIDSLNFQLEEKKHLLIIGPSGCGKTTLLTLMCGLQRPESGSIFYNQTNICDLKEEQLDKFRGQNLGIIFQNFHLIKVLTLYENLAIALKFSGQKIDKDKIYNYLAKIGLTDKSKQKAGNLSVGESQRLAVARAVITNPKWIFCDEPTSALDDKNTQLTLELLQQEAQSCQASLIVITHDQRVKNIFSNQQIIEL